MLACAIVNEKNNTADGAAVYAYTHVTYTTIVQTTYTNC